MTPQEDIMAGVASQPPITYQPDKPDSPVNPPEDPKARVRRIAEQRKIPVDVADDYLNITGGIESGNRQYRKSGEVLRGSQTKQTGDRAFGMGQVMSDHPGTHVRTIKGEQFDLRDQDQNLAAGLTLFNGGGADPVRRRINYFGPAGLKYYDRTGRIPPGGDGYTTYAEYVRRTMPKDAKHPALTQPTIKPEEDIYAGVTAANQNPSLKGEGASKPEEDIAAGVAASPPGSSSPEPMAAQPAVPVSDDTGERPSLLTDRNRAAITRPRTVAPQQPPAPSTNLLPLAKQPATGIQPEKQPAQMGDSFYGLQEPGVTEKVDYPWTVKSASSGKTASLSDEQARMIAERVYGKGSFDAMANMPQPVRERAIDTAYKMGEVEDAKNLATTLDKQQTQQQGQARAQAQQRRQAAVSARQRKLMVEVTRMQWRAANAQAAANADPELAKKLLMEPENASDSDVVKWARNRGAGQSFQFQPTSQRGGFTFQHPTEPQQIVQNVDAYQKSPQGIVEEEMKRSGPGLPSLSTRLINRGVDIGTVRQAMNQQPSAPQESVLASPEQNAQARANYRQQIRANAQRLSDAETEGMRNQSVGAIRTAMRVLSPAFLAADTAVGHVALGQTGPKVLGELTDTVADIMHFADRANAAKAGARAAGGKLEEHYTQALIEKLRDFGAYMQGRGDITPKGPIEAGVKQGAGLVGAAEKYEILKGATGGLPFWAIMGGEAALRTQDQPLKVAAPEIAQNVVFGLAVEFGPGLVSKAFGKLPGPVGALARRLPTTIGVGTTAAGFGGLAGYETYKRGGTPAEVIGATAGAGLGVAAMSLTGLKEEAKSNIAEAGEWVARETGVPENVRAAGARAAGREPVIVKKAGEEEYMSVFLNKETMRETEALRRHAQNLYANGDMDGAREVVQKIRDLEDANHVITPLTAAEANARTNRRTAEVPADFFDQAAERAGFKPAPGSRTLSGEESLPESNQLTPQPPKTEPPQSAEPSEPPSLAVTNISELKGEQPNATQTGQKPESDIEQHQGTSPGQNLRPQQGEVRETESGQAGSGDRARELPSTPARDDETAPQRIPGVRGQSELVSDDDLESMFDENIGKRKGAAPAQVDEGPGTKHPETGRKFSSTQVDLPPETAKLQKQAAAQIPDSELAADGREGDAHITVKYGLHSDDPEEVRKVLADEPPIRARIGKVSIFPAKEGTDYDVVKMDVLSPDLHRLNGKIAKNLDVTDTHPEYTPHVTLAYVKPGEGAKYVGQSNPLTGKEVTIKNVLFSGRSGREESIPLTGKSESNESTQTDQSIRPQPPSVAGGIRDVGAPAPKLDNPQAIRKRLSEIDAQVRALPSATDPRATSLMEEAATLRRQLPKPKSKPAPAKSEPLKWTEIGKNRDGQTVYEDQYGVRSALNNDGIRVSEPVSLTPTRQGMVRSVDESKRGIQFKTVSESKPTASDITGAAKTAGKEVSAGLKSAAKAIDEILKAGSKGTTLGSGPPVDEETYQALKPHLIEAASHFYKAGMSIKDVINALMDYLLDVYGMAVEQLQQLKPHILRFMKEYRDGEINLEEARDAAHDAATSPENGLAEPTQGQKEAGNYQKGHIRVDGLDVSIENPAGSIRKGKDTSGKAWSIELDSHYGYIKRTEGADGEHIDTFVKPDPTGKYDGPEYTDGPVFVVHQTKGNGHFDEHKVLLGWGSEAEAKDAYLANYTSGWDKRIRSIHTFAHPSEFKEWLKTGDTTKIVEPAEAAPPDYGTIDNPNVPAIADNIATEFTQGRGFKLITDARRYVADLLGGPVKPGTPAAKSVDEAVELAVVKRARMLVEENRFERDSGLKEAPESEHRTYNDLVRLYEDQQPNLSVKTSSSVANQAYSTPVPLAYVASRLAGITEDTQSVYEPTAGNGALLLEADPRAIVANEKDADRIANLEALLPDANIQSHDATEWSPNPKQSDAVIANPPFGIMRDAKGETVRFQVTPSYETQEMDHAISFKALDAMKDDGHAVLLLAGVKAEDQAARAKGYSGLAKRGFYYELYQAYNVVDHFTVAGDLYKKQGAAWPIDVVVIHGRGKSQRRLPAADVPRIYNSWDELEGVLDEPYRKSLDAETTTGTTRAGGRDQGLRRPGTEPESLAGPTARPDTESLGEGSGPGGSIREPIGSSGRSGDQLQPGDRGRSDVEGEGGTTLSGRRPATEVSGTGHPGPAPESLSGERPTGASGVRGNDARKLDEQSSGKRSEPRPVEAVDITKSQAPYKPASGAYSILRGRSGEPKQNFSTIGRLEHIWKSGGGLGQLERLNEPLYKAARRAAGSRTTGKINFRVAMQRVQAILKTKDKFDNFIAARYHALLQGPHGKREMWEDMGTLSRDLPDNELKEFYAGTGPGTGARNLVLILEGIPFGKEYKESAGFDPEDSLSGAVDSFLATDDINAARNYLGSLFDAAADSTMSIMPDAEYQQVLRYPEFDAANSAFEDLIGKPMAEAHSLNEGVFSDYTGPYGYMPLVPVDREGNVLHRMAMSMKRGREYQPPANRRNKFATGLSEFGYDVSPAALAGAVSEAERVNSIANMIRTGFKEGIFIKLKRGEAPPREIDYQGETYNAKVIDATKPKIVITKDGRQIHIPAVRMALPDFLHHELAPILEQGDFGRGKFVKFINAVNRFALTGIVMPAMHVRNIQSALIAGTPYVGNNVISKTVGNLPFTKWLNVWANLAAANPWDEDAADDFREMSQLGLMPSRYGTVASGLTYKGRQYAGQVGAKKKYLSLEPVIYGPGGIDARARLIMWRGMKSFAPHATAAQQAKYMDQLGNYTWELHGAVEKFLKQYGLDPFYTAASTYYWNGIRAAFGAIPLPTKGETVGKRMVMRIASLLSGGVVGTVLLWAAMYRAYTGMWPWEDRRARLLQIPLNDKDRQHWLAQKLYGKGSNTAYVGLALFSPLIERGFRATGITPGYDALKSGATKGQASEESVKSIINSAGHPFLGGPAPAAGFTLLTGKRPYLSSVRDFTGREDVGLLPAIRPTQPGLPEWKARFVAASLGVNSFFGTLAEDAGAAENPLKSKKEEDKSVRPNPWLRTIIDLTFPRLIRTGDPDKDTKRFATQEKAITSAVKRGEGQSTSKQRHTGPKGPGGPRAPRGPRMP